MEVFHDTATGCHLKYGITGEHIPAVQAGTRFT